MSSIPPIHFGSVYIKMPELSWWLECQEQEPPARVSLKKVEDEFNQCLREGNGTEGLLVSTNRGERRRELKKYAHAETPEQDGNPFVSKHISNLGVVLTREDTQLLPISDLSSFDPNEFKKQFNSILGGEKAIIRLKETPAELALEDLVGTREIRGLKYDVYSIRGEYTSAKDNKKKEEITITDMGEDVFKARWWFEGNPSSRPTGKNASLIRKNKD